MKRRYFALSPYLVIVFTTFLTFLPSLFNGIQTNWDDQVYILDNPLISNLNLFDIITTPWMGHYHPLTILSYAIEQLIFGQNALIFHSTNLLLHIVNSLLVYVLAKKIIEKPIPSVLSAMLFALHPLHVESVAWISERKDVLFCLFFLLAIIYYFTYINKRLKWQHLALVYLFFGLSVLSKSTAVVLPLVLFSIDWYLQRSDKKRLVLEKIPMLLISVAFGIINMHTQEAARLIVPDYSLINHFFIVIYAVSFYIISFFFPHNLSAIYYFPEPVNGSLPTKYYLSLVTILLLFFVIVYLAKKKNRLVLWGILFFIITIGLTSQIIIIGGAVVADRYSYIPYIGLSISVISFIEQKIIHKKQLVYGFLSLATIILAIISYQRCHVWKDSYALFSDVIKKEPEGNLAYYLRANIAFDQYLQNKTGNLSTVEADINKAINLKINNEKAFVIRGNIKFLKGDFTGMIEDNSKAIGLNNRFTTAYYNRGLGYANTGQYIKAIADFSTTLKLDKSFTKAYSDRATSWYLLDSIDYAINDYSSALKYEPGNSKILYYRGLCYLQKGQKANACKDWQKAAGLNNRDALNALKQYCETD